MLTNGFKVSSSGAALAILCFFLPWVVVSCSGQPVLTLSGWDMAAGTTLDTGFGSESIPGEPIMFLALLPGLAVFGVAYVFSKRQKVNQLNKVGLIGLGVLPLLVILFQTSGMRSAAEEQGLFFQIEYQFGLWGILLGYLGVVAGGVMNIRETIPSQQAQQVSAGGPPKFCMHCGAPNQAGFRFCMKCGQELAPIS